MGSAHGHIAKSRRSYGLKPGFLTVGLVVFVSPDV